ncbi:RCC1 and BTB domain-containing protein 1 [Extremus antarcticus]|uniref:RCC1 and BTB domain-containing protein 1 n=1 Tax=Extremus antarcticus TaxID=702011 RepID=A0AAJ0DBG3_9PEZI|nr:RCC1 and BTB domain-containing protein 1 [Extremus antarcticus]
MANSVTEAIMKLFDSPQSSDCKIVCGDREWPAHKIVICTQFEYFTKVLTGGFKASKDGVVQFHEDDPEIIHRMLEWLYTEKYYARNPGGLSQIEVHARVY